ncbi:pilus assembly protein [Thiolapillus sp.]
MKAKQYAHTVHKTFFLSALLSLGMASSAIQADDVEVYRTQQNDAVIKPNLLFVLDESSSMTAKDGDSTTRTEELRAALEAIFETEANGGVANVNAAFLGYSRRKYGGRRVITTGTSTGFYEVGDDDNPLQRSDLRSKIPTIYGISGTTTVQAMRSAIQWFKEEFTDDDGLENYDGCYTDKNDCPSGTGRTNDNATTDDHDTHVITPVTEAEYCAQNVVVLLTDGAPYSNQESSNSKYDDPHPYKDANYRYDPTDVTVPSATGTKCTNPYFSWSRAACTADIAAWANSNDLHPSIQGNQNVITHTIGFHTGSDERGYLQNIATRGGGNYYESDNTAGLVTAINEIIIEAQSSIDFTFNAPAIPFDPSNAATSSNDLYLPLLKPDVTKFWQGNLKKYRIAFNTTTEQLDITAQGGAAVVNDDLAFQDVRDFWNAGSSDGGDPLIGGSASKMTGTRHLYTYLGTESALTHADNRVIQTNTSITKAMLGLGPTEDTKRNTLLYWSNWLESDGSTARQGVMGAPLHTQPIVVGDTVYINTTEGMLHAFNTNDGTERWAFIPDELLPTIEETKATVDDPDSNGATVPNYGLDGPMTYYELGNQKYLVFGMRRGGRNYYALNITNPAEPTFAWEIKGGVTTGYDNLGQTWSKPIFAEIERAGNSVQKVLIFGGGYDPIKEDSDPVATTRPTHASVLGNSIFIVNPATGTKIQEITSVVQGTLGNSIAADILPVDINANGILDRLYVADVGGRIIRVDIPDAAISQITGSNSVSATVLADVGGVNGYQRFYNTPEVAYYDRGGVRYLALMISSGYRPSPLDTSITDRFYMIKDANVWTAPADSDSDGDPDYGAPITDDQTPSTPDLYDATANLIQDGNNATAVDGDGNATDTGSKLYAQQQLDKAKGWYIDFASGEKGFSEAKIWAYAVIFNTYKAERTGGNDTCVAAATSGESRTYVLDMTNGSAKFDTNGGLFDQTSTSDPDKNDRSVLLNIPGMPPAPSLIFPSGSDYVHAGGGNLKFQIKWPDRFHAISWEERIDD